MMVLLHFRFFFFLFFFRWHIKCLVLRFAGHAGFWYVSGNNNILSLIDESGVVVARDVGSATLNYNVSASLVTSAEV